MTPFLLIGLHNKRFVSDVSGHVALMRGNFQTVVVESGDALGAWPLGGHVLRAVAPGVVPFLNQGLEYLRAVASPGDWFVRIDCDDYYGPDYLTHVIASRENDAVASGISNVYVRTEDDRLLLARGKNPSCAGAPGGTLAGDIFRAVPFRSTSAWGEDQIWCEDMRSLGRHVVDRPGAGYALQRHAGHSHTWPVTGEQLVHVWPCYAYDMGRWDPQVVNRGDSVGSYIPPDLVLAVAAMRRLQVAQDTHGENK